MLQIPCKLGESTLNRYLVIIQKNTTKHVLNRHENEDHFGPQVTTCPPLYSYWQVWLINIQFFILAQLMSLSSLFIMDDLVH